MKDIDEMIKFYEGINKTTILYIESALLPHNWKFTYPNWLKEILSSYLAWKVNRKYNKIQIELWRLKNIKFMRIKYKINK